jgi:MFS family permease
MKNMLNVFRRVNRVIRALILCDFFLHSAWGFLSPVFAVFVVQNITVGDAKEGLKVAGFATLFYWITKSLLQVPLSKEFDENRGERDDYWFMVIVLFITGLSPFGFLISSLPWHIYFFQVIHAIGMAMFVPSWNAIFTRHMDTKKAAYEWGLDSTFLGMGIAIAGAIGGILASILGFNLLFVLTGLFSMFSAFLLLAVHKNILPRDRLFTSLPFIKNRNV